MSTPQAFTIHRAASGPEAKWAVGDERVAQLWLPIIGPTSFCILGVFDRDLSAEAEYFARVTYRLTDFADRLGAKAPRAFQSLLRLERHGLLSRDHDEHRDDHPVFVVDGAVRKVGELEWPLLPASVRERFATLEL